MTLNGGRGTKTSGSSSERLREKKEFVSLDIVKNEPVEGPAIWFELNEVDTRLLAKGIVSTEVQRQAAACLAWCEDDPVGYVDESFLDLGRKPA